jgi:hypothetical protein
LNELRPCPAATLGKPVVIASSPANQGTADVRPAAFMEPAAFPRGAESEVWTDTADKADTGTEFAIDRPIVVPTAAVAASPGALQLAGVTTNADPAALPALSPANSLSTDGSPPTIVTSDGDIRYPRFYVSGEYLLWWLKQDKVPILATTSSNVFDNGELGKPTTQVLFGGGGLDGSGRSGMRFTAGWWLDDTCKDDAIEVRGFYLSPRSTNFSADSSQFPVIARPFYNINFGEEFSQLTATPGVETGRLTINNDSNLWGAEINNRYNLCCGCNYRVDLLAGFRYVDLEESLNITENSLNISSGPPFPGDTSVVNDFFSTRNQFYGGQVGIVADYDYGPFNAVLRATLAMGDTHQDILIDGSQVFTDPGTGVQHDFKGGLLALPTNIGRYHRDRFSVIPEMNLNVGYQLTDHVRAFVGYDVLYWNNVVRPGGQIDRNIDISFIPNFIPGVKPTGSDQPSAPRESTDFWAQGITVGLEVRY